MKNIINIGIDVGSTTVKVLVTKEDMVLHSEYRRHFSDTIKTLTDILRDIASKFDDDKFRIILTGSGAIALSEFIGVPFVQEVIACKEAIKEYPKHIDVAIELGGEDAKIIYFGSSIEQRMNGSCAGGTGAFLDQMAVLLNTDTVGLNELAKNGKTIYPIASRCGVFAKTDIQPLMNEGAKKEDIAISIMQAVVNQTISGLACGKPIRGNVMFLGGPLSYLDSLRDRFISTLNLSEDSSVIPNDAHMFVCLGAIHCNMKSKPITKQDLLDKIKKMSRFKEKKSDSLPALFKNPKHYKEFVEKHSKESVKTNDIANYHGDAFLGIDAGSTTAKLVLIDDKGALLYSCYKSNKGTPVDTIKDMLIDLYKVVHDGITLRVSGSTGYGEHLIKTAFNLDISEIETMAHYTASNHFLKGVTSIIDIGGQDMKYIKIKDGAIDTIMLNEACSSGCGSFIETFAKSLNITIVEFVKLAVESKSPVDLGSRCTVFMNSKIKQTQKEGRPLGDIFAGLSYSVVKNALLKVMKLRDIESLGKKIVVQGGTFLNDAVLRAFEIITDKEVVRPDIAGLMGAYGIALIALNEYKEYEDKNVNSSILSLGEIENLTVRTTHTRCNLCENKCGLTVNMFNQKRFISGNRCERGSGNGQIGQNLPNMYQYKYDRLFDYESLNEDNALRGSIGIPRVLNMYENYPFWHTLFTNLGFRVVLSDQSNRTMYEKGIESIPSESVCYPAKLVHGHIINLLEHGLKTIFYPCIMYENREFSSSDNIYNCPIVTSYSEAIKLNVEELREEEIELINPFLPFDSKSLLKKLLEVKEFKKYNFSRRELRHAIKRAVFEQNRFREDIVNKGKEYIKYINDNNEKAIVLAGRPYHLDKEINHGIDTMINSLGLAVLTEDSICYDSEIDSTLRVVDQWAYHSRIYHAADVISKYDNLELVSLNSFGCGLDAIITDQTEEILKYNGRLYTTIKIDEINNLGAVKIRIRSLIASMNKRINEHKYSTYKYQKQLFTKDMKKTHTILIPDMSPFHMGLLTDALRSEDYNVVYLESTNDDMVETGLKYVNNDACYPSIIVVGQLVSALQSGEYDLNDTAVLITQTGGGCRATNYIGLIRKALKDAGFEHIPIISFNLSGLEKSQGFKLTLPLIKKALMAIIYGDLLMKLSYQTRPYEKKLGETNKIYDKWHNVCVNSIKRASTKEFRNNIKMIIRDFNSIKVKDIVIPKVGIVGEILIKYHHFGNNYLAESLEQEGAEVIVPELMGFVKYSAYNGIVKSKLLGESKKVAFYSRVILNVIGWYENTARKELAKTRFRNLTNIYELAENVDDILSLGNQTGEGWFLTAEIVELIKHGVNNVLCIQPFACLPNHIVGKAVIKKIKELYPESNIVAVDYDPGASRTNQTNRIKLMLSIARDNLKKEFEDKGYEKNK